MVICILSFVFVNSTYSKLLCYNNNDFDVLTQISIPTRVEKQVICYIAYVKS